MDQNTVLSTFLISIMMLLSRCHGFGGRPIAKILISIFIDKTRYI